MITQSPSSIYLGRSRCFVSNLLLFRNRASCCRRIASAMSSGLPSSCRVRTASTSSRLISSFHGSTVHVEIAVSVGITGACPVISSPGIKPVTELCVVRSAHSAYGSIYGQSFTLPSHAFASALTIRLCPRLIFPLASRLYVIVNVNELHVRERIP